MAHKLIDKLGRYIEKDYRVTVEIHLNDLPIHDVEISVTDYNKARAMKKAMRYVEEGATVKATGCQKVQKNG